MLNKECENCGQVFYKKRSRSERDFLERARFCSNSCKVKKQIGFYKYWEGKKRPDLLNKKSAQTMFKKGQTPWTKGKLGKDSINYKHGMSETDFYKRWSAIKQRCENKNHKQYQDYGGRGIRNEWENFEQFKTDMFESFVKHVEEHGEKQTRIERINNDGNYCKANCKWATCSEQMRNRRNNHMITIKGKTQCMTDWANEAGISYSALWKRFKKMSVEKALGYEV